MVTTRLPRRPGQPTTCGYLLSKRWRGASLTKFSIPGRRPTPSGSSKSGYIPKNRHGWRWKHSEEGEAAPGRRLRVEPQFVLLHPNLSHYYPASYQAPLASEATRADPASARYYAVR